MQKDTTKKQPRAKRGFLSLFTTPTTLNQPNEKPQDSIYLQKILKLQQENQELRYKNHQLTQRKTRNSKIPPQSPVIAQKIDENPQPTQSTDGNSKGNNKPLKTLNYLHLLTPNTLEYILGRGEHNNTIIQDISKEPMLLIAGKTGSGKSVTMFNILVSVAYSNTPDTLKISLIDPKILSFGDRRIINSKFLNEEPSIGCNNRAEEILKNAYNSMMDRYHLMLRRGVKDYRKINLHAHVIFIDEVFELLEGSNGKEILSYITRIASLGRQAGVHLVMGTQSPRAKTLSGTLKANLEFIGHRMSNPTESKLIELPDAHKLKGMGDGLRVLIGESNPTRFQATFMDIEEDETYQFFLSEKPQREVEDEERIAIDILKDKILLSANLKGEIKNKACFVDNTNRAELRAWKIATDELKKSEKIVFKKGVGYFLQGVM